MSNHLWIACDKKILLTTYAAGSQSLTFTAADFMIKDDVPKSANENIQTGDRIHRIDPGRRKKEVRYYNMMSSYSQEFLDAMVL